MNKNALNSSSFYFVMPDGAGYQVQQLKRVNKSDGIYTIKGTVTGPENGKIAFYLDANSMYARLTLPEHQYILERIAEGFLAIYEIDLSNLPNPEGEAGLPVNPLEPVRKDVSQFMTYGVTSQAASVAELDILFIYSAAALKLQSNIVLISSAIIDDLNEAFETGGISIMANSVGVQQTSFSEQGSLQADRSSIIAYFPAQQLRNSTNADIVVLITADGGFNPEPCGIAALKPDAENAYAAVSAKCLNVNYVVSHEIGHIFGADHNSENATQGNNIPYAHGVRSFGKQTYCYSTIMAYSVSCGNGYSNLMTTLNQFSSPYSQVLTSGGFVTAGDAAYADNARVLRDQAAAVTSFRAKKQ